MNDPTSPQVLPETGPSPPAGPSPPCPPVGWERIVASGCLARGPVNFWGIVLSDAAAIVATVYDGLNAAGRPVCSAQTGGLGVPTTTILLVRPLLLQHGLFVNLDAAPDDCLVLFEPLPGG
jgi:hypothetical protein